MNIDHQIREVLGPLTNFSLREIAKNRSKEHWLFSNEQQQFKATEQNIENLFPTLLTAIWNDYVSYINKLSDTKKKSYALVEGRQILRSIKIDIEYKKYIIEIKGNTDGILDEIDDECSPTGFRLENIEAKLFDAICKELGYYTEVCVNKIESFYQKLQLRLSSVELFDTDCPFVLVEGISRRLAIKKLENLYNYVYENKIIETDVISFQNYFLGGPMKNLFKWNQDISFFPIFIRELLLSELLIKPPKPNSKYWDYLLARSRDKYNKLIPPSIKTTSRHGSENEREQYIYRPLETLK